MGKGAFHQAASDPRTHGGRREPTWSLGRLSYRHTSSKSTSQPASSREKQKEGRQGQRVTPGGPNPAFPAFPAFPSGPGQPKLLKVIL